jgi:hypothetical protein
VENGGYYPNASEEMVGLSVDEDKRHVPATVHRMSLADITARVTALRQDGEGGWLDDPEGNPYSSETVDAEVAALLTMLGIPDLA